MKPLQNALHTGISLYPYSTAANYHLELSVKHAPIKRAPMVRGYELSKWPATIRVHIELVRHLFVQLPVKIFIFIHFL